MNPQETMRLFLDAIRQGDRRKAQEHADNLNEWLARGGFRPRVDVAQGSIDSFSGNVEVLGITEGDLNVGVWFGQPVYFNPTDRLMISRRFW